jgi:hypothetical protein
MLNQGSISLMVASCTHAGISRLVILLCVCVWSLRPLISAELALNVSSPLLTLNDAQRQTEIEARLRATPVSWAAGIYVLDELVAKLHATGNDTNLGKLVDGKQKLSVPACTGDYWQGIITLCTTFDLLVQPGEGMDVGEDSGRFGNRDNNGIAVIATGGPVRLVPRPAQRPKPMYVACGMLLAEITEVHIELREGREISRTATIETSFRFEPRVKPLEIGTTLMAWRVAEDMVGRKLESSESARETQPEIALVRLETIPDPFTGCTLHGDLLVQTLEPVTLAATMSPGDKARVNVLAQEISLHFIGENETTAQGQRGPGLSVSLPTAVLGTRPQLRVLSGDQPVIFTNQGSHWSGGRIELFFRGPRQVAGPYQVSLIGQAALEQLRLPLRIPVLLHALPTGEKALIKGSELQVPSLVSWPAGEIDLKSALAHVSAHNQVLLELGVDEKRTANVPAFSGHFWDGVLAVCRAFQLTLLPATQVIRPTDNYEDSIISCMSGGPLCLGVPREDRLELSRFQARGMVLISLDDVAVVTKHGFDGFSREAELAYRVRFEPRFDTALIGGASVAWTSLGGVSDGKPLMVNENSAHQSEGERSNVRFMRVGKRLIRIPTGEDAADSTGAARQVGVITVSGLPAQAVELTAHGQITLQLRRPVRVEVPLIAGERSVVALGEHALMVRMFDDQDDQGAGAKRSGVMLEMASEYVDAIDLEVRDAQERSVRSTDSNNNSNGRLRMAWYFAELQNGPYTATITAYERLATLCLPITVQAKTP